MGMRLYGELDWKVSSKSYQTPEYGDRPPKYAVCRNGKYVRGENGSYLVSPPNKLIMTLIDETTGQKYTDDVMLYIQDYKFGHPLLRFRMTKKSREKLENMIREWIKNGKITVKVNERNNTYIICGLYKLVDEFFSQIT